MDRAAAAVRPVKSRLMEERGEAERQPWLASPCGELSREDGGPLTPALVDDEEEGGGISGDDDVGAVRRSGPNEWNTQP
jgi:hypothetical protein